MLGGFVSWLQSVNVPWASWKKISMLLVLLTQVCALSKWRGIDSVPVQTINCSCSACFGKHSIDVLIFCFCKNSCKSDVFTCSLKTSVWLFLSGNSSTVQSAAAGLYQTLCLTLTPHPQFTLFSINLYMFITSCWRWKRNIVVLYASVFILFVCPQKYQRNHWSDFSQTYRKKTLTVNLQVINIWIQINSWWLSCFLTLTNTEMAVAVLFFFFFTKIGLNVLWELTDLLRSHNIPWSCALPSQVSSKSLYLLHLLV